MDLHDQLQAGAVLHSFRVSIVLIVEDLAVTVNKGNNKITELRNEEQQCPLLLIIG
jgi:hypothetical protein